jgi:hypothetical protein
MRITSRKTNAIIHKKNSIREIKKENILLNGSEAKNDFKNKENFPGNGGITG